MKRTIAFILTAVMVLGMIPATVITAFAHGYGVAKNPTENQSINNALGQAIPETVKVDGILDDTGWSHDLWYDVNSDSGVWSNLSVETGNKDLAYRYQIRTDYHYFYTAIEIDLPKGQGAAMYSIYLSDVNPTSVPDAKRGATGGFVFTFDENATDKVTVKAEKGYDEYYKEHYDELVEGLTFQTDSNGQYVINDNGNKDYYLKKEDCTTNNGKTILSVKDQLGYADNKEASPSETVNEYNAHQLEYRVEGNKENGYKVIIEFRNRALDTYNTDFTLRYYASVGVPRETPIGEGYGYDYLYHPPYCRSAGTDSFTYIVPTFENWPGTGAQVNYTDDLSGGDANTVPGAIKVDGIFDEALWSGMTNYYTAESAYGDANYKSTVTSNPFGTIVDLSTVGYNEKADKNSNYNGTTNQEVWPELRFKYDVRTDSEYLYAAIYVYARLGNETRVAMRFFNEENAHTYTISLSCAQGATHCTTAKLERVVAKTTDNGKTYDEVLEEFDESRFEAAATSKGVYYVYEIKAPLEVLDDDSSNFKWSNTQGKEDYQKPVVDNTNNDGLYYSITVGNYGVKESTANKVAKDTTFWSSCGIGKDVDSYTKDKDVSIRKKIENTKYVGSASESVVIDGKLDDAAWTAIRGADRVFDYSTRANATDTTQKYQNLIYQIEADSDYLYGAAYIVLNNEGAWDAEMTGNDKNRTLLRLTIHPYATKNVSTDTLHSRIINFSLKNGKNGAPAIETLIYNNGDYVSSGDTFISLGGNIGGEVQFKFEGKKVLVEFKLNLDDLGIERGIKATDDDKIYFGYHISVEDSALGNSASSTGSAICHPALGSIGGIYDYKGTNESLYAKYANVYTFGDVLDPIVIDGNVEESVWDDMIHVNDANGAHKKESYQAYALDYDYKVYVGNRYLYGAVIVDDVITDKSNSRFTIWFDNGVDERTTMPTAAVSKANTVEFEHYYNKAVFESGEILETTEIHYFVNHNYSFSLNADAAQYSGDYPENTWDNNPEANPDYYLSGSEATHVQKRNGEHYKYAVTKINGVTYLEFVIDLDSVHCDPENFRYYVCYEYTVNKTEDEALELYHPIPDEQSDVFWLTHVDVTDTHGGYEAGGLLFTSFDKYNAAKRDNLQYWEQIALKKNNDGTYTVTQQIHSYSGTIRYLQEEAGCIYYAINAGAYNNNLNQRNVRASRAFNFIKTLKVGDTVKLDLNGDSLTTSWNKLHRTIIAYKTSADDNGTNLYKGEISMPTQNRIDSSKYNTTGWFTGTGSSSLREWQLSGYYVPYTMTRIRSAEATLANLTRRNRLMPTFGKFGTSECWMHITSGTVVPLTFITPEGIEIDGSLGDSGWNKNGWILVDGNKNATNYKNTDGVTYKYQVKVDGEYLYVAAVLDTIFKEGVSFRIWLNGDNGEQFNNYYELAYGEGTVLNDVIGKVSQELQAESLTEIAANGVTLDNGSVTYPFAINAVQNDSEYKNLGYGASAIFGRTEELVENTSDGVWVWEAYPMTYGFRYANEYGVISSGDGVAVNDAVSSSENTVVEFKIALSEFGGNDGFEYYVQATSADGATVYPQIFSEIESTYSYYDYNYPDVNWDNGISLDTSDISAPSDLWLLDKYAPVVTLGAKINANYEAADGEKYKAIRLGALYTEEYIRKLPVSETDSVTDYWDVADVGIIALPTAYVAAGAKLDHSNSDAVCTSAINIVNWIYDSKTGEGTNFADYENFVFYATFYGIPDGIELSFAAYIDYYNENGTETYYDTEFVRSYSMVEQLVNENSNLPE